ncbi:MAG: glycosyltransferase family 4 protein, partial [Daejeonella sp.]
MSQISLKTPPQVLFLTLKMFSVTGGIEEVCRVFSRTLFDLGFKLKDFKVYSLYDKPLERKSRFVSEKNFKGFNHVRSLFLSFCLLTGRKSQIVVISHVNLLFVALLIKKTSPRTRIIMFAHGVEIWREISNWKKVFLRKHCEIWAVSEFTAKKISEEHQINPDKIYILPNCLNPFLRIPKSFEKPKSLLKRYNLKAEQPILYTLTRLSSHEIYKGYDKVIESLPELLKLYPNLHYLIAGSADEAEKIRLIKLIDKLNLKKYVTLAGFIPETEFINHFNLADVFIMPSRKEGFGIVFIEAAACGCKIIA